jgi:phosphatidylglycerophosphatase A
MTTASLRARGAVALASFGYVGFFPFAPGTAGSAAALVIFLPVRWAGSLALEIALAALVAVTGVWAATEAERALGRQDPGPVVIDEVAGMLVSLFFLPATWPVIVTAFLAFRIFDIIKPWPCDALERLHGGLGIMADDLAAGVYANLTVQFLIRIIPGLLA